MAEVLVARINAALPQTQCTRCGYPDCHSYASAIAEGRAQINQCPPGGAEGIQRLAEITGRAAQPLNPEHGQEGPRHVAFIDEDWCIGCTLCIEACPTDAIIGSNKHMHTVIEADCTGCELCIPVCPVDCIVLENVTGEHTGWAAWSAPLADQALQRYTRKKQRALLQEQVHLAAQQDKAKAKLADLQAHTHAHSEDEAARKRAVIEAALAKARARQLALQQTPPAGKHTP
jgi:Na+-translocating ferredoxin:NAD+ oxidoreductase subunit B